MATSTTIPTPTPAAPVSPVAPAAPVNTSTVGTPVAPTAVPSPTPIRTITTAYTSPTPAPPVVPTTNTTTAQNALGAATAAYGAGLKTAATPPVAAGTAPDGSPATPTTSSILSDTLKSIMGLTTKLAGKGQATLDANAQYGVDDKTKLAQKLSSDYNAKSEYYDHQIEKVQSQNTQGKSAQAIQEEVAQLTRQKNSELADISIQHATAVGDLSTASTLAKNKVDAEFEPLQTQVDNLKTYYSLASNDMTESEKTAAQAAIQERQAALDEQKQMRLKQYDEQIKKSDPLYQAQVANERRLAAGGGTSPTATQAAGNVFGSLNAYIKPGQTIPGTKGVPVLQTGTQFLTKDAFQAFVDYGGQNGVKRADIIAQYAPYLNPNAYSAYGLTGADVATLTNTSKAPVPTPDGG